MQTNSVLVQNSRYVSGGRSEVNDRAIEWWERAVLTPDITDTEYVIEARHAGRLDTIAYLFLNDTRLWWVIAQFNAVLDPFHEIVEGRVLRIPSKERVRAMLQGRVGGYETERQVPLTNITPLV